MDEQNQQQTTIEPTSETENLSVGTQGKEHKFNTVFIFGIIILVFTAAGAAYYLVTQQNKPFTKDTQNQPTLSITETPASGEVLVSPPQAVDLVPQENSIYFGTYQDKDALFFTNKNKQTYYENGESKTSKYIGELITSENVGFSPFDYKDLTKPVNILSSSSKPIFSINSFVSNNSKDTVYVSINYIKEGYQYPDMLNSILQIKIDGSLSKEIWSNDIGSDRYLKAKGAAYPTQISEDKYLTLWIADCYACSGSYAGTIVQNIGSKAEIFRESIGDVQINLSAKTWSYKKLAPFKELCEVEGPGCDNGQRTVMKPTGQIYTENLP